MIKIIKRHPAKQWIISSIEIKNSKTKYKVTRRLPELGIAETKIFFNKKKAKKQFRKWLK